MTKGKISIVAILAVVALSSIARPPISSMGALLPEIVESLQLTAIEAGLIASTPVFIFGFGAFVSPLLVKRFGVNHTIFYMGILLAIALSIRVSGNYLALFAGTFGVGLAIAIINVLLPNVIRTEFKNHIAAATGLYTALFGLTASAAAVVSVPISKNFGGWQISLGLWALLAVIAVVIWLPLIRRRERHKIESVSTITNDRASVLGSKSGIQIILFFGLQSAGFYLVLNWLPTILVDFGYSGHAAGNLLGLTTIVGVPLATVSSFFFKKIQNLGSLAALISLVTVAGYAALIAGGPLTIVGCLMIGIGQAMTFPLVLTLIATKPSTSGQVTQLSTWAQGAGYLMAAVATFMAGLIRDVSGNWTISLIFIMGISLLQALVGFFAGRPGKIAA